MSTMYPETSAAARLATQPSAAGLVSHRPPSARGVSSFALERAEEIAHQDPPSRAGLDKVPGRGLTHEEPEICDASRQRPSEGRAEIRRGHEITFEPERRSRRVIAVLRIEERGLHEIGEGDRSARPYARDDPLGQVSHAGIAHPRGRRLTRRKLPCGSMSSKIAVNPAIGARAHSAHPCAQTMTAYVTVAARTLSQTGHDQRVVNALNVARVFRAARTGSLLARQIHSRIAPVKRRRNAMSARTCQKN